MRSIVARIIKASYTISITIAAHTSTRLEIYGSFNIVVKAIVEIEGMVIVEDILDFTAYDPIFVFIIKLPATLGRTTITVI